MSFFSRLRLPPTRRLYPNGQYKRTPFGLCVLYANVAFFGHIFTTYWYSMTIPWGASMLPTIYFTNESLLISKRYRRGKDVQVGDMVSFRSPVKPWEGAIKRVIGMPGDFVLRDSPDSPSDMMIQVPEGHCWVVGDNLPASRDSRMYGPLPLALVKGKVVARIWPYSRWTVFKSALEEVEDTGV